MAVLRGGTRVKPMMIAIIAGATILVFWGTFSVGSLTNAGEEGDARVKKRSLEDVESAISERLEGIAQLERSIQAKSQTGDEGERDDVADGVDLDELGPGGGDGNTPAKTLQGTGAQSEESEASDQALQAGNDPETVNDPEADEEGTVVNWRADRWQEDGKTEGEQEASGGDKEKGGEEETEEEKEGEEKVEETEAGDGLELDGERHDTEEEKAKPEADKGDAVAVKADDWDDTAEGDDAVEGEGEPAKEGGAEGTNENAGGQANAEGGGGGEATGGDGKGEGGGGGGDGGDQNKDVGGDKAETQGGEGTDRDQEPSKKDSGGEGSAENGQQDDAGEDGDDDKSGGDEKSDEKMALKEKVRQWKKFTLGPKIHDWNKQRSRFIAANPGINKNRFGKPRIMMVTASDPKPCQQPMGDGLLLKFTKNKIDYARRKDIDIYWAQGNLRDDFDIYWSKLPLIRMLMLAHPEIEWFWWLDSDAMITDMTFDIPLPRYTEYNLVIHGWREMVYDTSDWTGLNAGIYLIRNTRRSLDLIDEWAAFGPKGEVRDYWGPLFTKALKTRPGNFESDDQAALIWLLQHKREKWDQYVKIENSYNLHSFWVPVVETYEELMKTSHPGYGDNRWPFITHFVGCKLCGLKASYSFEKCMHHILRAFHFADNQVLNTYGYQHASLASSDVVAMPNATAVGSNQNGETQRQGRRRLLRQI